MKYGFSLEWDELDEELRERKIDEYIEYLYNEGEYLDRETGEQTLSLEEALEDENIRRNAESMISARFPIYF